jgi:hypothetical protein
LSLPPEYAAVCHILQARATGDQFSRSDLNILTDSLNWPVQLRVSDDHRFFEQNKQVSRSAAELLMEYLNSLIWSHVPQAIGICVSCQGLFLRIKANQAACSDSCRFQSLKAQKYRKARKISFDTQPPAQWGKPKRAARNCLVVILLLRDHAWQQA